VAEGTRLESELTGNRNTGSNPVVSVDHRNPVVDLLTNDGT
jgi:hypothetical protein